MLKLTHYSDSGHGWFAVKRYVLAQFGLLSEISKCSFQSKSGETVYLEEDCDAAKLITYLEGHSISFDVNEKNINGSSPIRYYDRFVHKIAG